MHHRPTNGRTDGPTDLLRVELARAQSDEIGVRAGQRQVWGRKPLGGRTLVEVAVNNNLEQSRVLSEGCVGECVEGSRDRTVPEGANDRLAGEPQKRRLAWSSRGGGGLPPRSPLLLLPSRSLRRSRVHSFESILNTTMPCMHASASARL
jgi:hypothetical protein